MSGALKSVFSGSGIFGAALSLASMFFPPLAIAGSLSNMLTSALGEAVKQAAGMLVKELGMPKFVQSIINQVVDQALSQQKPNETNPQVDAHTQQHFGEAVNDFKNEAAVDLFNAVKKLQQQNLESTDDNRTKAKAGSKKSAGSWLEAIAQAMGDALGQKAAKMVELSNKIASTAGKEGKDAAAENAKATTEMSATSQMFNLMNSAFTNAIKSIGEGLTQAARKG